MNSRLTLVLCFGEYSFRFCVFFLHRFVCPFKGHITFVSIIFLARHFCLVCYFYILVFWVRPFAVVTCIFLVYFSSNRIEYCFRIVYRNVYRIGYLTLKKKLRNALEQWFFGPFNKHALSIPFFRQKRLKNHTLWGSTNLYTLLAGSISPRPGFTRCTDSWKKQDS